MIGEISVDGVYVPSLLVLFCAAVILSALLFRLLSLIGFYRLVVYRPAMDIAIFLMVLGAIVWLTAAWGLRA